MSYGNQQSPSQPWKSGHVENWTGLDAPQSAEAPLSSQLNSLVNNIANLEQSLSTLSGRLTPVSVSAPQPGSGANEAKNVRSDCAVVDSLKSSNERIRILNERVQIMVNELQV